MSINGSENKMEAKGEEITIIDVEARSTSNSSKPVVAGISKEPKMAKVPKKKTKTITVANNSTNKSEKKASAKKNDKTPDQMRTFRFNLTLNNKKHKDTNNNHDNCFNWLELVAKEEKQRVKDKMIEIVKKKNEGADSIAKLTLAEIEAQAEELTRKFEAKYGSPTESIKKKKKDRKIDDHADLAFGYDSDDSFIDDSEVLDDQVPETVQTEYGGFYINTGKLEFRARESEDSDVEAVIKAGEKEAKLVKKKRIKTKAVGDDEEDSSDDPEDRHRGSVNPRFASERKK